MRIRIYLLQLLTAECKAMETCAPSLKYVLMLALAFSSLVDVSNGQCSDAYGCSVGEVCCWGGMCVSGSSCKGQFCEYYTDCFSHKLICCNMVCVKRSNCLGEDCLDNSDCSVGEKCCKKKCVAGDHCRKGSAKCGFTCGIILSTVLPCLFVFILIFCCPSCRQNQRRAESGGDSGRQQEASTCDSCCPVRHIWYLVVQVDNPDTKEGSAPPPPEHAESQERSGGVYTPQASYGAVRN